MSTDFYSTKNQFLRELGTWWKRRQTRTLFFGAVLVVLSFYCLNSPGHSQVYDVAIPYLAAAYLLTFAIGVQFDVEVRGVTATFFKNLPRTPNMAFAARLFYFLGYALFFEILIGVGIAFQLGGAAITPIYRIHPELVSLPFVAVFFSLWYAQGPRSLRRTLGAGLLVGLCPGFLIVRYVLQPEATESNQFIPPRDLPLALEWALAVAMVGVGLCACWANRCCATDAKGTRE